MQSTISQKRQREQWLNGSTQIIGPNLCTVLELLKRTLVKKSGAGPVVSATTVSDNVDAPPGLNN